MTETVKNRIGSWYKIYTELHERPFLSIQTISQNTGISRSTVSRYLNTMKITKVMKGPYLQMRALPNYQEFIYLLDFSDPFCVFEGLKSFPHILYHAMTFGDWNTLIITDLSLDFSQLKGFENLPFSGLKQKSATPKISLSIWDQSFDHIYRTLRRI